MSSLDSLMIEGIRTFCPDEPQVIKFYPITLILGKNGAGKTTIIECLRYITSGEFPPNTYKGKTWIHDPSLIKKKVKCVRAQVKLKFNDVFKNVPVATKNLELVLTSDRSGNVKTSVRTIDFTIKTVDQETGDVKSLVSTKCAEVEGLMLDHLGVSKAVLTSVIFCHQEESNWPLSESKLLKEKFDQIFGSTGYVKALKKIKDMRKQYMDNIKLIKKDLLYLQELKEQFEKLDADRQRQQEQLEKLKADEAQCEQDLVPVEKRLNEIYLKEEEVGKLTEQIAKISGRLEAEVSGCNTLKEQINDLFEGSKEELEKFLNCFREKMTAKETKTKEFDQILEKLEQQIDEQRLELEAAQAYRSELLLSEKELADLVVKRNEFLQEKLVQLNLDSQYMDTGDSVEEQVNRKFALIRSAYKKKEQDFATQLLSIEKILQKSEKDLDRIKNLVVFSDQTISIETKNVKKLEMDVNTIRVNLSQSSSAESRLDRLDEELRKGRAMLETQRSAIDINGLDKQITEATKDKARLSAEVDALMSKYKQSMESKDLRNRITEHEQQIREKQNLVNALMLKNRDFAKNLCSQWENPNYSFYSEIHNDIERLDIQMSQHQSQRRELDRQVMTAESTLKNKREQMNSFQIQIQKDERLVKQFCGVHSLDQMLLETKKKMDNLKQNLQQCNSKRLILSRVLPLLEEEDCCPVCETDLEVTGRKLQVKQKISKDLQTLPDDNVPLERDLEQLEQRFIKLKELKSSQEQVEEIRQKSSNLKHDLEEIASLLQEKQIKIKDMEEVIKTNEQQLVAMKKVIPDALKFDETNRTIRSLKQKLQSLQSEFECFNGITESPEQIDFELNEHQEQLRDAEHLIEKLNRKKQSGQEQMELTRSRIIKLEQEKIEVEKNQQADARLRDDLSHKTKEIELLNEEIKENETKLVTQRRQQKAEECRREDLVKELQKLTRERDELKMRSREFEEKMEDKRNRIEDLRNRFDQNGFEQNKLELDQFQANLQLLREKRQKMENRRKESGQLLEDARKEERDLKQNLEYLKSKERIRKLKQEQSDVKKRLGAEDLSDLMQLKQKLQSQLQNLQQNRQVAISCRAPVQTRLKEVERDLRQEKYKDINKSFLQKQLDLHLQTIVSEDLNKYFVALDKSVITFHKRKMEEINMLINRFWKTTYRGIDIDTIRIVSEEEQIKSADSRKSYNYRVVMVKSGHEMDMRGRCSAGQKVLACLIIRLALAEIFCVNCGVLALDEPTTNLDKESIISFSNSIKELMESHSKHKNFQLIIITHDEEFLRCLDDENDYYYKVTQNEEGHSCIEKHSIRDRD